MKRMLFNATQEEELRVAMVDGQRLYDLNIELPASERKKANIYKGKITRVEPSLEAAFVNYGAERHGFLPLKEVSPEYFVGNHSGGKPNIREVLKEGQDIVVQIDKEERGNKGAALTTYVSLAGRFIVLKPNKSRSGGVSRRIVGDDRDSARESLKAVNIPDGMSVILRTAGIDRSAEELEWDLNNLLAIWEAIKTVVVQKTSPFLIYRESDSVVRALRDYLTTEIGEILIDDEKAHQQAQEFIEQVMPHNLRKLKHYQDPVPLFTRYQIESQIESAFAHQVTLPSGGSMVIDHTEALVSIDINSARATKGGDIEATALQTNLEASDEIGRQLRLRDLGGLIVIDFIDMGPQKHQREVEARLREAVRQDRARVQIGKISRFGLLEMSRQRLRPSLGESSYLTCPRCSGVGTIRSVESLALAILRIIGEEARKERTAKVIAQLPVEVATYLLNEKRDWVQNVEARHNMQVILVANPSLETPHYLVRRVRDDQVELPENMGTSYELTETEEEQLIPQAIQPKAPAEVPAVSSQVATTPPPARPVPVEPTTPGLLSRIIGIFTSGDDEPEPAEKKSAKKTGGRGKKKQSKKRRRNDSRQSDGQRGNRGRNAKSGNQEAGGGNDDAQGAKKAKKKRRSKKKTKKKAQPEGGSDTQQEKSSSRRRSRGGRRRRRNQDAADGGARNDQDHQNNHQNSQQNKQQNTQQTSQSDKGSAEQNAGQQGKPANDAPASSKPARDSDAGQSKGNDRRGDGDNGSLTSDAGKGESRTKSSSAEQKPGGEQSPKSSPAKPAGDNASSGNGATAKPKASEKPARSDGGNQSDKGSAERSASQGDSGKQEPRDRSAGDPGSDKPRLLPWEPQPSGGSSPDAKSDS